MEEPLIPLIGTAAPANPSASALRLPVPPAPAPPKRTTRQLRVRHTTRYTYDKPIRRSTHKLHLHPIADWRQAVLNYSLVTTPAAPIVEFEDVFGNWASRFEITQPYDELVITSDSTVELLDVDPFAFASLPIRPSFPLVWMPWERTMLAPYLHPPELPETQLQEIYEYAMGFVRRNDGDLMETLFAINLALYHDFQYASGSTCMETTPHQVLMTRRGVCQDFANLVICMARLLGIPARYVCGYLYTGRGEDQSRATSDASHAWVQLYIPNIGWKGFDPTNGNLPGLNHIRIGYGRHYLDCTPTAGTYYGPARESMSIDVQVTEVMPSKAAARPVETITIESAATTSSDHAVEPAERAPA